MGKFNSASTLNSKINFIQTDIDPDILVGKNIPEAKNALILSSYNNAFDSSLSMLTSDNDGSIYRLTYDPAELENKLYDLYNQLSELSKKIDEYSAIDDTLYSSIIGTAGDNTVSNSSNESSSNNSSNSDGGSNSNNSSNSSNESNSDGESNSNNESDSGKSTGLSGELFETDEWKAFAEIAGLENVEEIEVSNNALNDLLGQIDEGITDTKNNIEEQTSQTTDALDSLVSNLTNETYADIIVDESTSNNQIYELKHPIKGKHTVYMVDDGSIRQWSVTFLSSADATSAPYSLPFTKSSSEGQTKTLTDILDHNVNEIPVEYTHVKFTTKNIDSYEPNQLKKYVAIVANEFDTPEYIANQLEMALQLNALKERTEKFLSELRFSDIFVDYGSKWDYRGYRPDNMYYWQMDENGNFPITEIRWYKLQQDITITEYVALVYMYRFRKNQYMFLLANNDFSDIWHFDDNDIRRNSSLGKKIELEGEDEWPLWSFEEAGEIGHTYSYIGVQTIEDNYPGDAEERRLRFGLTSNAGYHDIYDKYTYSNRPNSNYTFDTLCSLKRTFKENDINKKNYWTVKISDTTPVIGFFDHDAYPDYKNAWFYEDPEWVYNIAPDEYIRKRPYPPLQHILDSKNINIYSLGSTISGSYVLVNFNNFESYGIFDYQTCGYIVYLIPTTLTNEEFMECFTETNENYAINGGNASNKLLYEYSNPYHENYNGIYILINSGENDTRLEPYSIGLPRGIIYDRVAIFKWCPESVSQGQNIQCDIIFGLI